MINCLGKIDTIDQNIQFLDWIDFIDGTFIIICMPQQNDIHKTWFNEHKKIYSMNNMVGY